MNPVRAKVVHRWSGCHRMLVEKAGQIQWTQRGETTTHCSGKSCDGSGLPAPLGEEDAVPSSSITSFCCWCHSDIVAQLMPTSESPLPTPTFWKQKKNFLCNRAFSSSLCLPCNFIFSHSQSGLKGLSFRVLLDFHRNQCQINACNTVLSTTQHWFWGEG